MQAPFDIVVCFGLGVSPKNLISQIVDIDKKFFTNYILACVFKNRINRKSGCPATLRPCCTVCPCLHGKY